MNPCENEIFTLNVATRELHPFGGKGLSGATWTNNHREISYLNGGPSDIYTANLDNGSAQYFVDGQRAAWSSDGKYVAIVREDKNAEPGYSRSVIIIRDMSAGGQEKIVFETPKSTSNYITGLTWSSDNTRLALSARWSVGVGAESGLYIYNMGGYGLRQLAENIEQPGWMPGGSWLFFIQEGKLVFAPIDFACTLTPLSLEHLNAPTISPMGSYIAFEYEHSIYLLNLDQVLGKNREKLVCPD
jgi:Tol biopolymer transport system component